MNRSKATQADLFATFGGEELILTGENISHPQGEPIDDLPTLEQISKRTDTQTLNLFDHENN